MFKKITKKFDNNFITNFLTLSGGNFIASAIVLIFSPLITRLYSPENFGSFQIFISISTYFTLLACFRLEYALLIKNSNNFTRFKINLLCTISLIIVTVISIFFSFYAFFFKTEIYLSLNSLIFYLPFITFFGGLVLIYTVNCISSQKFKLLSKSKITQNSSLTLSQILFSLLGFSSFGLFMSDIISKISFVSQNFNYKYFGLILSRLQLISMKRLILIFKRFKTFALLMAPSKLFNVSASSIPIILIGNSYGLVVVGFYFLIDRIFAPITILVSEAISRVFESRLTGINKVGSNLYSKSIGIIIFSVVLLIPFVLVSPFIENMIVFIFGENWIGSGKYYNILLPMFIIGIISSNLSNTLIILENHKLQLIWDVARSFFVIFIVYFSINSENEFFHTLKMYSYSMSIFYFVHIILSLYAIRKNSQ